jgi:hypothetical protein
MKTYPTFREADGGEGGGNGGGGTTLLGAADSTASTTASTTSATGQHSADDATKAAFDFRSSLDAAGNFKADWQNSLPEELRASAGKYTSPLNLITGLHNANKLIGQKSAALTAPSPDAKPEDIAKHQANVRAALGIPEKLDDYKIAMPEKLPEGVTVDEKQVKEFSALAHSLGIPAATAAKLVEFNMKSMAGLQQGGQAKLQEFVKSQSDALQKEWGEKTPENIARAKSAAEKLGLDINDPQLGNNAPFIKAMFTASGLMKDDKLIGTDSASVTSGGPAQAEDIRRNPNNPWHGAFMGKEGPERAREAQGHVLRLQGHKV